MINWLERRRKISSILTILIAIEIFAFSNISFTTGEGNALSLSIIYHFVVFFLFAFFLLITIKGTKKIKIKYILIVLTISLIYAILDEIHQSFIPGRNAGFRDVLTDISGSITSILIYTYISEDLKNKNKN